MTGGTAINRADNDTTRALRRDVALLVAEHYDMLLPLARVLLGDDRAAVDAVLGTAVRCYEGDFERIVEQPVVELQALLFQEARRWNVRRRTKVRPTSSDETTRVIHALQQLSARQRECVVGRHYLRQTEKEAAETAHLTVGSVRTHYKRGMAFLVGLLPLDPSGPLTLEALLQGGMRDFANREFEPVHPEDIVVALEQHDRNKLVQRVVTGGIALVLAVVIAWSAVNGGPRHRHVRIENPPTTVPAIHNKRGARSAGDGHAQQAQLVNAVSVSPAPARGPAGEPSPNAVPNTEGTTPNHGTVPPRTNTPGTGEAQGVVIDTTSFWAIGAQVPNSNGNFFSNELLVHMPPGSHKLVYAALNGATNTTQIVDDPAGGTLTAIVPADWQSASPHWAALCAGCPDTLLGGAFADSRSSMPNFAQGLSAFAIPHEADLGGILIAGAVPAAEGTQVEMTSPYGNGVFNVHGGLWGGIVKFRDAPLNVPFVVTLTSTAPGRGSVTVTATRTR